MSPLVSPKIAWLTPTPLVIHAGLVSRSAPRWRSSGARSCGASSTAGVHDAPQVFIGGSRCSQLLKWRLPPSAHGSLLSSPSHFSQQWVALTDGSLCTKYSQSKVGHFLSS